MKHVRAAQWSVPVYLAGVGWSGGSWARECGPGYFLLDAVLLLAPLVVVYAFLFLLFWLNTLRARRPNVAVFAIAGAVFAAGAAVATASPPMARSPDCAMP